MTPPVSFVKKLLAYDPDLRIVWSLNKECWLIERRIRRQRLDYANSPDPDVNRRFHDGFIHVGNVAPRMLDERVLLTLWENDMWKHGGAKRINALLDDYYESKERHESRSQRSDLKGIAGDMWDYLAWRRKAKINVPAAIEG